MDTWIKNVTDQEYFLDIPAAWALGFLGYDISGTAYFLQGDTDPVKKNRKSVWADDCGDGRSFRGADGEACLLML